ncbi:HPP family protein [Massilia sp. H-1]|nr:HPP family protein [Massilia sp. H-1]
MFALRCLHPPGGAVALTAVLGGPAVHALGYRFALCPVALNSLLMVAAALLYNKLSGRRYPHAQRSPLHNPHLTADVAPRRAWAFSAKTWTPSCAATARCSTSAATTWKTSSWPPRPRRTSAASGIITCGQVMSRDSVTVEYGTDLGEAWRSLRRHRLHAMPVLNRGYSA